MIPEERAEQIALVNWLSSENIFHFSIPNGGSRNAIEAKNLNREGLKKGASDLVVMLDNTILFVEMKKQKGGRISNEQIEFIDKVNRFEYSVGFVAYGWQDARDKINFYRGIDEVILTASC